MFEQSKIAFVGGGAMGEAIIAGLLERKLVNPDQIVASDPVEARQQQMAQEYGVQVTGDNQTAVQGADIVVLAVKPQIFPKAAPGLKGRIPPGALVLSIMAGVSLDSMQESLDHTKVLRSIPNTPAQIGMGMTVWTALPAVGQGQKEQAVAILEALGEQIEVNEERYLDMATGLSGSGPGFVFLLVEAMIDAGVQIGFARPDAEKMVLQTMLGSLALMQESDLHPAELRNRVTSPGGTTAAGIFEMEAGGLRATITRTIDAAWRRSVELDAANKTKESA